MNKATFEINIDWNLRKKLEYNCSLYNCNKGAGGKDKTSTSIDDEKFHEIWQQLRAACSETFKLVASSYVRFVKQENN